MPATLLTLPRQLRERIYDYLWSDITTVRLYPVDSLAHAREQHLAQTSSSGLRRRNAPVGEKAVLPYPPGGSKLRNPRERLRPGPEASMKETDSGVFFTGDRDVELEHTIRFDVRAFLKAHDEEDDEEEDEDDKYDDSGDDDDDDYDDDDDDEDSNSTPPKHRLKSLYPINLNLFLVSHQISTESIPIFYKTTTFHPTPPSALTTLHFLNTLSPLALSSITSLTLPPHHLDPENPGWSSSSASLYHSPPTNLTLTTPFASYLATTLPSLQSLTIHLPPTPHPPPPSPIQLDLLDLHLHHPNTPTLTLIFTGPHAHRTLRSTPRRPIPIPNRDSISILDPRATLLLGPWADADALAAREFDLAARRRGGDAVVEYSSRAYARMMGYVAERHAYVLANRVALGWEWGEREGVDGGEAGMVVQAVLVLGG